MASCIAILDGVGRCRILLNVTVDFIGTYSVKHWVLIKWSWTWVNLDVVEEK